MLSRVLNLAFPSTCPVCNEASDVHIHNPICSTCWQGIKKYEGPGCKICGLPTASGHTGRCEECLTGRAFEAIRYYGIYEKALKEAIHILKFNSVKRLADPLAELLVELTPPQYDLIVPVPLHPGRLKERGFCHTALIGRYLSKKIGLPLLPDGIIKVRETELQTAVSGKGRRANLKKAFAASTKVSNKKILLIDDVITTGATVSECSLALNKSGASEITVLALARSMPKW